ncbi:MAG: biopolymer transporter ExbD [Gemmataceae bacterium]|nr:biopolymer transporter ExbD [Gemmataceae bacterium]
MNWFYRVGKNDSAGEAMPAEVFLDLIHSGIITPDDDIKRGEETLWKKGWEYPELAPHFSPIPKRDSNEDDHIDMNALIDVCLVLLVFFLIVTSYARLIQHLEAAKNQGNQATPVLQASQVEKLVRVRIEKNGQEVQYFLNGAPVQVANLVESLRQAGKIAEKKDLLLEYPDEVPYESVIKVQDAARGADFQQILQVVPGEKP